MKKIGIIAIVFVILLTGCISTQPNSRENKKVSHVVKSSKDEQDGWDLTVFDPNFEIFLNSFAKPESMYTESFLKSQNQLLVNEWNTYYYAGRYKNLIESSIDYDPSENYGIDFQYKLYQVFVYMYKAYGLRFTGINSAS